MNRGAVFAPNWLGDAVMCLPALAALRAATPETAWTVLARPAVAPVFALARLGLEVAVLPGRAHSLRLPPIQAELAIIFPNSFHAALLALRTGARRRIGYARDGRSWLLRPAIELPAPGSLPGHESFYYLELLRRAGFVAALPPESPPGLRVALHPDPAIVARWRAQLGAGPIVAMHAGATFGTAKQWLPERFAELARALADRGAVTVLIGGRGEYALAERVRRLSLRPERVRIEAGQTTLEELVALLAAVNLVVANDSGPMHLAGAVGTPLVAIFGSTNERETYPLSLAGGLHIVKAPGIECSPCKLRECPIDHRCMTRIEVSTVLAAIEEIACFEPRHG
ncbi:MAG: lipopolysaccharide heptosyltransferase II [Terriglobales bacterium]